MNTATTALIATLPGYHSLYALYFDYPINNAFFQKEENAARMVEFVRTVRQIENLLQPYRKSWALRLFTERESLSRFSPELVNEALRQLRGVVELIGPPPGWNGEEILARETRRPGGHLTVS